MNVFFYSYRVIKNFSIILNEITSNLIFVNNNLF